METTQVTQLTDQVLPDQVAEVDPTVEAARRGLPLWIPLLGLVAAFLFAVFIGIRICPALSGLVFVPEPPLPPGEFNLVETFNKGSGRDEFVYQGSIQPCELATYYTNLFNTRFNYDINAPCGTGNGVFEGTEYIVGTIQGRQDIGALSVFWEVRINGAVNSEFPSSFRVVREMGK